jgi:uncharacterized protein with HEPN domain
MSDNRFTLRDRLEDILESINLIQEWTVDKTTVDDFMTSSTGIPSDTMARHLWIEKYHFT